MVAIDCTFSNCVAASSGPDIGGGAIRMINHKLVQVSGCTFSGCQGSNGGAIDSLGCELEVIASAFANCKATGTGGGADQGASGQGGIGGAIYVDGVHQFGLSPKLNVSSCIFTTNSANDHAGAIFAFTYEGTGSQCVFDSCFFDTNTVTLGTAVGKGGAIYHQDCGMALRRSTFKGNSTNKLGGALFSSCDVGVIEDCTFQGNQVTGSGGVAAFGGALNITGTFTLNALTLSGNTAASWSGGIWTGSAATTTIMNSILDRNTGVDAFNGWNTNATLVDGGNNIQFLATAHVDPPLTATAIHSDPMLSPLADNGGPNLGPGAGVHAPTMALLAGSPAIHAGNAATAPAADERGVAWVGTPNIGSY
jgi:hypothetical protein